MPSFCGLEEASDTIKVEVNGVLNSLSPNAQITPNHPFLSRNDLPPLMKHASLPMPMQQRHPRFQTHCYWLQFRVRLCS
jgi:hypothetical protein